MITGLAAASQNGRNAIRVRELFRGSRVLVFPSLDTVGVQVCAAAKNVVAIAFGMLDAIAGKSACEADSGARPGRVRRQYRVPPPRGRTQRDAGPRHRPGRDPPRDLHLDRGSGRPRRHLPLRARAQPPLRPRDRREGDPRPPSATSTTSSPASPSWATCPRARSPASTSPPSPPRAGWTCRSWAASHRILDRRSEPLQFLEEYLAAMGALPKSALRRRRFGRGLEIDDYGHHHGSFLSALPSDRELAGPPWRSSSRHRYGPPLEALRFPGGPFLLGPQEGRFLG